MLYLDGANMNALLGVAKPGQWRGYRAAQSAQNFFDATRRRRSGCWSGRGQESSRAVPADARISKTSSGYEFDIERPDSIGRLRSFHNNFGMIVRAYAYILALGGDGLAMASRLAILGANYVRKRLDGHFPSATAEPSMHECVLSHDLESAPM